MEADFETKKKMLFASLENAEKNLQGTILEQKDNSGDLSYANQTRKRNRDEYTDKYKNRGSLFKRPNLPISKCLKSRKQPDYVKNPNKWQHYSLDDVSDTSERMNTSAAFSFLKEIEARKDSESVMNIDDENNTSKIVFKKSVRLKPKQQEIDPHLDTKKIQSTKIVMPEYVVGQKKEKPKRDRKPKDREQAGTSKLKLSHLDEELDDADEN
ncbi:CLUMA_CG003897, isoform A [Clunio marinus]|uniref:U5 small nuclear ribonucleoprotein TSSC4 n=1 Tax=Clunio marinus TaxID=568069 RepID=A0A1J1HQ60_9DIPT|nr:CLUMA_CG003897, isoform A [Clunio marinus]